jgi:anti-sigma factor RsiW
MACSLNSDTAAALIVGYGARTLEPAVQGEFERHLESCASCREHVAHQQLVWAALDELPSAAVSPDFDQKLFQRIAAEERGCWWQRSFRSRWIWGPAAPVAVAGAILLATTLMKKPPQPAAAVPPSQPEMRIEQVERALDDMDMLTAIGVEIAPANANPSDKL